MANSTGQANSVFLLFFAIIWVAQGSRTEVVDPYIQRIPHASTSVRKLNSQGSSEQWGSRKLGRVMIGSTAPTCTYNECRGCKYKCRAEQVPVEGNDPINSPYHYKCVCHR